MTDDRIVNARERTFLARQNNLGSWTRTSCAFMALGAGLDQFAQHHRAGILFVLFSCMISIAANFQYFKNIKQRPSDYLATPLDFVGIIAGILGFILIGFLS